jgi:ring-1,2-phenylacetyl-CoA epoxidase subunit PaaD
MLSEAQAWQILNQVPDPEIPVISVTELGIVRAVQATPDTLTVVVTPTYSGCPATEMIEENIRQALADAGSQPVRIEVRLAPPWTTDWIAPPAAEKLRAYGIVPPGPAAPAGSHVVRVFPRLACPRCNSTDTERLSEFGATACKALYRCRACGEPFEYFKPL